MIHLNLGQWQVYGGGTFVSLYPLYAKAQAVAGPEILSLMSKPMPVYQMTLGDAVSLGGLTLVFVRLAFDFYKHFKEEKRRKSDSDKAND